VPAQTALLRRLGIAPVPGERLVSLFCYPDSPFEALAQALGTEPTLVLLTPGAATQAQPRMQAAAALGLAHPTALRCQTLPWLSQRDYDTLLSACDLNFVRGEDSAARAQWAARPFVWQLYRQDDGAHLHKATAFLDRFTPLLPAPEGIALAQLWRGWNGDGALPPASAWPTAPTWGAACETWCRRLRTQPSLSEQLLAFVAAKRA
jgi:uncharacterized repeat protein (TIGR03837 family)